MLDHLAQSDASGVRADGHAQLGCHQVDGEHVVEAGHAGGVDLAVLHPAALQELLEHDPVLAHLARSNADA